MITVSDIVKLIEDFSPSFLAFDGDNVGLIVGRSDKKVSKILITLDVDEKVADEAVKLGCDAIVSHHPLMFRPIKRLTDKDPMQRTLCTLVANDVALVSAHTNLDCVAGGLNDLLAQKLGITETSVIDVVSDYDGRKHGFGRVGVVEDNLTLSDMLKRCVDVLGANGLRYTGDINKTVRKVAVNCGGGSDEMNWCIDNGVDLFITGDVKYNPFRDAYDNGMAVIDAGHYETEKIVTEIFGSLFSKHFDDVELFVSQSNVAVIEYYTKTF